MRDTDFIDTNILVYAYDNHVPHKQQQAQEVILQGIRNDNIVISTQVLGEFFTVVTRKINPPLPVKAAKEIITYLGRLTIQEIDYPIVKRALDTHEKYHLSYWDALIISAAERSFCKRILSEDFNSGQFYHGIEAVNPFT